MSNLFQFDSIKNHPSRSAFDLSRHQPFTAKAGELLPVYRCFTYPGDKFDLKIQHFTRTRPVNTAAFARIREYFDWYHVPLRLLSKSIQQAIVQMQSNPIQASGLMENQDITTDIPYTSLHSTDLASLDSFIFRSTTDGSSITQSTPNSSFITNFFGFKTSALSYKLLHYLRFGNFLYPKRTQAEWSAIGYTSAPFSSYDPRSSLPLNVNLLFLLAYQKIYADYGRFSQWEQNEPYTYNCDWYSGGSFFASLSSTSLISQYLQKNNLFTLRYCNWPKDVFMGLMPDQQFGEVALVDASSSSGEQFLNLVARKPSSSDPNYIEYQFQNLGQVSTPTDSQFPNRKTFTGTIVDTSGNTVNSGVASIGVSVPGSIASSFTVLQLRLAESIQKWKEISQFSDPDYKAQIEAHWNVKLSAALSDRCEYIGGSASNINISEVENNNLAVDGSQSTLAGKGVGSSQSYEKFSTNVNGILMCIYHAVPLIDYHVTGQSQDLLITNTADFPIPELDRIGMQALPIFSFANTPAYSQIASRFPMGYLPRYYMAKTDNDGILGAFLTTRKNWVITLDPNYLSTWFNNSITTSTSSVLNYAFFKCNPKVLDSIFAVAADSSVDTDQFDIDAFFDVKVVRNLDYSGMPY